MRNSTPFGRAVAGLALLFAACSARPMTAPDGPGGAAGMGSAGGAPADPPSTPPPDAAPPDAAPPDTASPDAVPPPPPDAESPSAQFKMLYATTLRPTCGGPGRFCHANELNLTKLD